MILAMVLAGSGIPVAKILTSELPVFLGNWLSLVIAWLILLPMVFFRRRQSGNKLPPLRVLLFPALQGLFGMALFRVFTFYGLRSLSAIEGGLLTATGPGMMAIMAFLLLRERPGWRRILGILLSVAGIFVLNYSSPRSDYSTVGVILILCAVLCESLLTIFRKLARGNIPSIENTFYIVSSCLLFLFPMALYEGLHFPLSSITPGQWGGCAYLGIFTTVIAYICWGSASVKIDANMTGIITGVMPLTATILSVVILKEEPVLRHGIGGLFILLALWISRRSRKTKNSVRSRVQSSSMN